MQPARRRGEQERGQGAHLATFLRGARDEILARWEHAARDLETVRELSPRQRFDHLPSVLDHLAEAAEEMEAGRPSHVRTEAAARHAYDRLEQGFDLASVVRELQLLRDSVIDLWGRISPADVAPLHLLDRVMGDAISASVEEYVNARERTLYAIDVVSAAALETRTIDELVERLLDAFLASTRSVTAAAILLFDDRGRLTVRTTAGLEPDVVEHFTVRRGTDREGFAAMVARLRAPVHASEDEIVRTMRPETLRARRIRALFGVPLLDGARVIGVAHMSSHSASCFPLVDRRLFESMTIRATAGIAQHAARELAQRHAAQLAASEQRFRATFDHAPIGIAHVGLDGTWLRFNDRYCQLLGYDQDELRTLRYQDLMHPDDFVRDGLVAHALIDGRMDTYATEKRYLRNDGRTVWVRLTASLVREEAGGQPYFVAIIEDITEHKAIEGALRAGEEKARLALGRECAAHHAAQRTLAALDSLLAAASAGVTIIDTQLRYVRVNETLARMNGVPVEQHVGRTVREVLGESAGPIEAWLHEVIDRGQVIVTEIVAPAEPPTSDRPRSLLVNLFPVSAPDGEILGVGGIVMDITDRKVMEDALRASEQQAQRSVALRDQVLAIVSHDLRNPLGAIRMAASLLLQLGTLHTEERRYTEVIDRAAARMDRLISDLVDFAGIEGGRLALDRQPHDVRAIVTDACELHQMLAQSKAIDLRCSPSIPELTIQCDRERILQVLGNLIGNALKFCTANDRIELDVSREGDEVAFIVSDTGPGVHPDLLAHLFEAYWTTARSVSEGTGLGLYISKGIVEAHGGRIGVRNRVPHGATFWFALPCDPG